MNNYKTINVFLDEKKVGTLATAKKVFLPKGYDPFEGLFGVDCKCFHSVNSIKI